MGNPEGGEVGQVIVLANVSETGNVPSVQTKSPLLAFLHHVDLRNEWTGFSAVLHRMIRNDKRANMSGFVKDALQNLSRALLYGMARGETCLSHSMRSLSAVLSLISSDCELS